MDELYIAWWNVENLFDNVRSDQRPDWLQDRLGNELKGWTTRVLDRKLRQLADVIMALNNGKGPDILGVCEVENSRVLGKLLDRLDTGRRYQVAHHDTADWRGIDVAFIYDADLLSADEQFDHVVLKRNATRDIFQVNFRTTAGTRLICIGNHWPSRSGGVLVSQPYRQMAGETLAYWMERIRDIHGPDTAVLVMGDFNDEPFNSSVSDYALACRDDRRVLSTRAQNNYLLNLMWPLMGAGAGTHYYDDWGMLDQLLVNRGLANGKGGLQLVPGSVEIVAFERLLKSGRPRRFGRPSATLDDDGFSDHLPIACRLRELPAG